MVKHRNRAARLLNNVRPVLDELTDILLDRLDDTNQRFTHALDFGGRGSLAPKLQQRGLSVDSADFSAPLAVLAGGRPITLQGPDDFGLVAGTYDLIIAPFSLHFLDDLPGALVQLRRALTPQGLLLASMPTFGTLQDLRVALLEAEEQLTGGVTPRVAPFPDLRDCAGLLQRTGFVHPVADSEELSFLYASPLALLRELRDAGETCALSARSRKFPPRALFAKALTNLPQQEGRTVAKLSMAILTGWSS